MITDINATGERVLGNTTYLITYSHNGIKNTLDARSYEHYISIMAILVKSQVDKTIPYQRVVYKKSKTP